MRLLLRLSAIAATVISRPAFFRAERQAHPRVSPERPQLWRAVVAALLFSAGTAAAEVVRLDIGRLEHEAFSLTGVTAELREEGRPAYLLIDEFVFGEHRWRDLRLRCDSLTLADGVIDCPQGQLSLEEGMALAALTLRFDANRGSGDLHLRFDDDEAAAIALLPEGKIHAELQGMSLARMASLFAPEVDLSAWSADARLSGEGELRTEEAHSSLRFAGELSQGQFSSADGLTAADGLAVGFDVQADAADAGWQWQLNADWRGGEAYLHPLYLKAPAGMHTLGSYHDDRLLVEHVALTLDGVATAEGAGEFDLSRMELTRAAAMVADADLAVIGPRFLAPVIAPAKVDSLKFAGLLNAGIELDSEGVKALSLGFDQVGFSDSESQLSFGPLSGAVPWRHDEVNLAHLHIGGGRWQKLTLGEFELEARMNGPVIDIANVEIPILDGALLLDDFVLQRDAAGWVGSGAATIRPISMNLLTEAIGLPSMSGILAASMPGMHIRPGSLTFDGMLQITVFDGSILATNLQVIEPFGKASHLYADVAAERLDLAQLTDTFSFGSVTGFIDARVSGLEMAQWQPVKFDAWIRNSPGRYAKRISQRAVQHISSLGGAGAVAAIQRGVLSFFDSFGYRRIGLSCQLSDGVAMLEGLASAELPNGEDPFLIVEGGGIPALTVIGYNRRMDWKELLDRLERVTEAETDPIVQ